MLQVVKQAVVLISHPKMTLTSIQIYDCRLQRIQQCISLRIPLHATLWGRGCPKLFTILPSASCAADVTGSYASSWFLLPKADGEQYLYLLAPELIHASKGVGVLLL